MTEVYFAVVTELNDRLLLWKILSHLSPERRAKAEALRDEGGRLLSVGAGYLLSYALKCRGIEERLCTYASGEYGKPYLAGHPNLAFSLAHSGIMVMCALSDDGEVGCDIEKIARRGQAIARRYFCESEQRHISASANPAEEFTRFWTLKESYIKALGTGLRTSLSTFEINPGPPPSVVGEDSLHFYEYTPAQGYRAALCTPGDPPASPVYVKFSEL